MNLPKEINIMFPVVIEPDTATARTFFMAGGHPGRAVRVDVRDIM
jgi:prolyl-tRNA editing enzyme YbaK/EbsC (Cys-tRNA(Pro) deacylase)